VSGCAIGTPDAAGEESSSLLPMPMGGAGAGGVGGVAGGGTGGAGGMTPLDPPDAGMAMFVGDPCAQGAMEPCACESSDVMGQRICLANAGSPSGGAFSECRGCPAVMPDAGEAGEGGIGGAGGASGMSGGASGMSGGTGGMIGGTGGTGGAPACMCTDALACCRDDGSCGVGVPGLCF
jgi:hypothetical protein